MTNKLIQLLKMQRVDVNVGKMVVPKRKRLVDQRGKSTVLVEKVEEE